MNVDAHAHRMTFLLTQTAVMVEQWVGRTFFISQGVM
jgi:hypothetical protein